MKSVDFQTALPKASELARTVQSQNKEGEAVQAHLVSRLGQQVSQRNRQVTSLPQAEDPRVEPQRSGDEGGGGRRQGDGEEGRAAAKEAQATGEEEGRDPHGAAAGAHLRGHKLDIVV